METVNWGGTDINLFLPEWELEAGARAQIEATSKHPYVNGPIAIMPDAHQGYGVAIGTVMVTQNVIIPNAVGVDIGCGVSFTNTNVPIDHFYSAEIKGFGALVRESIPVGFSWYESPVGRNPLDLRGAGYRWASDPERAALQFGTLGGGNHFLEMAVDQDGFIWLMVHSGSRGYGYGIAERFQQLAVEENHGGSRGLESLNIDRKSGSDYYLAMKSAEYYASESRKTMLLRMENAMRTMGFVPNGVIHDVPHNYAVIDQIDGSVIHRKGAVDASLHKVGIIPGSMGTKTYVTSGLGNPDSLMSSSHGAGRTMSRSQARKNISLEKFAASISGTYSTASPATIDESPDAYKDISTVMERQTSCVEILAVLDPLITIKGGGRDEG